jgi:hypothetical protein
MALTDAQTAHVAAAATSSSNKASTLWRACRACMSGAFWTPAFTWILLLYAVIETKVMDVRTPFVTLSTYSISWVEILYVAAFLAAIMELMKVSKPGQNNTVHAFGMTLVFIAYVVFFTLGAAGVGSLTLFATSEFIVLMLVSLIQVVMAFWINAATLQRTISNDTFD